jgi:ubiquinone/menaquinone biosynthesis C-methylase UbiE
MNEFGEEISEGDVNMGQQGELLGNASQNAVTNLDLDTRAQALQNTLESFDSSSRAYRALNRTLIEANDTLDRGTSFAHIIDFLYSHKDQYTYKQYHLGFPVSSQFTSIDDIVDRVTTFPAAYIEGLTHIDDEEKITTQLGMLVDRDGLSPVIELVRNMVDSGKYSQDTAVRLEAIGKRLIGLDPSDTRTFFASLKDIYEGLNFENYQANTPEVTRAEVDMIKSIMRRVGIEHSVVADIGCGTGRISNELGKDLNISHVIGLDPSPHNLEAARQFATAQGVADKVVYEPGDWNNLKLDDESVDAIVCIGRTFTHARNSEELERVFQEYNRILKKNGVVIFDFPNNAKGAYLENRKRTLAIMRSLKIPVPDDEVVLPYFEHVVDSPDKGMSIYDRYVPDLNRRMRFENRDYKGKLGRDTGFQIDEYMRAPIEGWEDSENIYFVAIKKGQPDPYINNLDSMH